MLGGGEAEIATFIGALGDRAQHGRLRVPQRILGQRLLRRAHHGEHQRGGLAEACERHHLVAHDRVDQREIGPVLVLALLAQQADAEVDLPALLGQGLAEDLELLPEEGLSASFSISSAISRTPRWSVRG